MIETANPTEKAWPQSILHWSNRNQANNWDQPREAHENLHTFMMNVFAGCGLFGQPAEDGSNMPRGLVRGYVLNEIMHTLIGVHSYEDSLESAAWVFVAGLPALVSQ